MSLQNNMLNTNELEKLIKASLAEDIGSGDVTSNSLVPAERQARATIISRRDYVIAGGPVAQMVFTAVDPNLRVEVLVADGQGVASGKSIMEITGNARSILAAERTALNFYQRLTGIASLTRRFVDVVAPYGARILDTRKTMPLWRALDKYAVACGGGTNHRFGLYDRVLIKDNHRFLWGKSEDLAGAVRLARAKNPGLMVEIEVESLAELRQVLPAKPEWILLDNMDVALMRQCVEICAHQCRLEASGGITLDNVAAVAATGVDAISLGCLTHSVHAADLSLEMEG